MSSSGAKSSLIIRGPCEPTVGSCPAGTKEDPVLGCSECGGAQAGTGGMCKGVRIFSMIHCVPRLNISSWLYIMISGKA